MLTGRAQLAAGCSEQGLLSQQEGVRGIHPSLLEAGASPPSPTCERVRVGQVVTREINEGAMLGVNELGLGGHVAGMFHGVGCVDHIHLQQRQKGSLSVPETDARCRARRDQRHPRRSLDRSC